MQLVFYCMDKVKRYKLSREAKNKADKNRTKVRVTNNRGTAKLLTFVLVLGCWKSLEVDPRCQGRESSWGEGEEEEGVEGADQGDRGPGEAEEDGGAREQEGEEEGSA